MQRIRVAVLSCLVAALIAAAVPAAAELSDPFHRFRLDSAGRTYGAYVLLMRGADAGPVLARLRGAGATVTNLPAARAVWVSGSETQLRHARALPGVERLLPPSRYHLADDTAAWATRARAVYEETGGQDLRIPLPAGGRVDGTGVGIAVLDTGIDGTHPDLEWAGLGGPNPKVLRNYQVVGGYLNTQDGPLVPAAFPESADTDTWGHGTHVAGVAAGSGTASGGRFAGVAPGAKIYGFNVMKTSPGLDAVSATLQWIYDHGHRLEPPIKVVNLSLGITGSGVPEPLENRLVDALIRDRGVTVVFAAMNAGGDGEEARTNVWGRNTTPGVISVANYDDGDAAATDGRLSPTSSRGSATDPASWPDVAAPGVDIVAPCPAARFSCTPFVVYTNGWDYDRWRHASLSGTSMAAPHVAGVAALLYQADPGLTPARVEQVLESTTRKFTWGAPYLPDPAHPGGTSSYDKGHGLVDARAAVATLLGAGDAADIGPSTTVARDGTDEQLPGAADVARVDVTEVAGRIRLTLHVRDLADAPPEGVAYGIRAAVAGRTLSLRMSMRDDGTPQASGSHSIVGTQREGNTITVDLDAWLLGVRRGRVLTAAAAQAFLQPAPGGVDANHPVLVDATDGRARSHVFIGP